MTLHIKRFPSEILSEIMAFVNGLYVIRLYLSGDNYFVQHLFRSVRDFRLTYRSYLSISWPHIISRFTLLKRLKIKVTGEASYIHIPNVDFTTIPPSVEYLYLDFPSSFKELLRHAPVDYGRAKRPLLSEILPNLRHIMWKDAYKPPETMTHSVARELISSLPRSIQQISSPYNHLKFADIADLPRSLTHMSIYLTEFRLEKPHFPENLSFLRIFRSFHIEELETSVWDYLPETLTKIEIVGIVMPLDKVSRLPKELVRLRVDWKELAPEALKLLPQSLLELELNILEVPTDGEAHKHFPKNLTSLSVLLHRRFIKIAESKDPVNLEVLFKYLPTTLKTFYHYMLPCAPEFWKYLPRGMESHTSAENGSIKDPSLLTTLPQNITSLCIFLSDPAMAQFLPSKLIDLRLTGTDDLNCVLVNVLSLSHLTVLECLEIGEGVKISMNEAPDEFPKLLDLVLETPVAWHSIDWRRPWASRLRYLSILVQPEENISSNEFPRRHSFPGDDWLATLPPSLIQLSYTSRGAHLPSSLLKYLPQTLQRVFIEGFLFNGPIDVHFRSLPTQLRSLSLYGASSDSKDFLTVSEETLRLFPPSLGSFLAYLTPNNPGIFNQLVELRPYIKYHSYLPAQQNYQEHLGQVLVF